MKMLDSIRTRLTLWYLGVLALVVIAFAVLTYFFTIHVLNRDTDKRLAEMARNFAVALKAEDAELQDETQDPTQPVLEIISEFNFRDYQFTVFADAGQIVASTAKFQVTDTGESPLPVYKTVSIGNADIFRIYISPLEIGKNHYRLFVLHSLHEQLEFQTRLTGFFLAAIPLSLLLAGLGGYFLARKSLLPMVEMSRQAAQISATNLHERLSVQNERDELGSLARVFNELLARLDESFEQQRRFMADASHELRTPLAIVRGESEVALSKDDRLAADYRESLAIVQDESKRLTKIVEDLFTLARADAGQFKTSFAPVYLDEIVSETVHSMGVLAKQKMIDLSFSSSAEMPLMADESLLRRLFLNLLDNALKYSHSGGKVSVVGELLNKNYAVKITDDGIGIPADEQKKIFERFYRIDKARSRQTETTFASGAGLGLSIAAWIAEIHGGKIELLSSGEKGSVFLVLFPVE